MFIVAGNKEGGQGHHRSLQEDAIFMSTVFYPNSIGVKYSLIMGGGGRFTPCLCFDLLIFQKLLFKFWIETLGICHDYGSIKQGNLFY